jgi:hypothetical protein
MLGADPRDFVPVRAVWHGSSGQYLGNAPTASPWLFNAYITKTYFFVIREGP